MGKKKTTLKKFLESIDTITTKLLTLVLFITTIPLVVVGSLSNDIINQSTFANAQAQLNMIKSTFIRQYYSERNNLSTHAANNIKNILENNNTSSYKEKAALINTVKQSFDLDFVLVIKNDGSAMLKTGDFNFKDFKHFFSSGFREYNTLEEINNELYEIALTPIKIPSKNQTLLLIIGKSLKKSSVSFMINNLSGANIITYRINDAQKVEVINSNLAYNLKPLNLVSNDIKDYYLKNGTLYIPGEFSINTPITNNAGKTLGYIYIGMPKDSFIAFAQENITLIGIIGVISLLVAIIIAALFARTITTPILNLASYAESLQLGNLDIKVNITGSDETAKLAKSFNQMVENIKKQEQLRDNFVATLTHDLKVPMLAENQTISYFLKGAYGSITEDQKEILELIKSTNRSSLEMVETLLDVYRYDCGQVELNRTDFNLNELMQEAITQIQSLAEEKNITINCKCNTENIVINADKREIKRVIHNLISNAINHGVRGGNINCIIEPFTDTCIYKPKVSNTSYTTLKLPVNLLSNVLISIEDNGVGITSEDMNLLFKRFSLSKGRKPAGTGLGLYYSSQVIKQHGGIIWTESSENSGAIFRFTLPLKK